MECNYFNHVLNMADSKATWNDFLQVIELYEANPCLVHLVFKDSSVSSHRDPEKKGYFGDSHCSRDNGGRDIPN